MDTFGAAIGIYRAAKTLEKKAYIVINTPNSSIRPLMDGFLHNQEYDSRMFVNSHEAKEIVDDNTVVVVVDTNRPNYTECEELLQTKQSWFLTITDKAKMLYRMQYYLILNPMLRLPVKWWQRFCSIFQMVFEFGISKRTVFMREL